MLVMCDKCKNFQKYSRYDWIKIELAGSLSRFLALVICLPPLIDRVKEVGAAETVEVVLSLQTLIVPGLSFMLASFQLFFGESASAYMKSQSFIVGCAVLSF